MTRRININVASNADELIAVLNALQNQIDNLIAQNTIDVANSAILAGDQILSPPTLAIGSTPTAVSNVAFTYQINGQTYNKAAVAAGTAPGNDVVPQSLYGAVAFDIGINGTVDAIEAADNATGYASAALAIADIAAVAADHVRMGTVSVIKSDGTFTFGTTQLDDANTTEVYTDAGSINTVLAANTAVSIELDQSR